MAIPIIDGVTFKYTPTLSVASEQLVPAASTVVSSNGKGLYFGATQLIVSGASGAVGNAVAPIVFTLIPDSISNQSGTGNAILDTITATAIGQFQQGQTIVSVPITVSVIDAGTTVVEMN